MQSDGKRVNHRSVVEYITRLARAGEIEKLTARMEHQNRENTLLLLAAVKISYF